MSKPTWNWLGVLATAIGVLCPTVAVVYSYGSLVTEVQHIRQDVDRLADAMEAHERWHVDRLAQQPDTLGHEISRSCPVSPDGLCPPTSARKAVLRRRQP